MRLLIALLIALLPCQAWAFQLVRSEVVASSGAFVTDSFSYSNGSLASASANWSNMTTGFIGTQTATVNTGKIIASASGYATAMYTGVAFADDQYAQTLLPAAASLNIGVGVRMTSTGNGYLARCTSATTCQISKVTDGTPAALGATITVSNWSGKTLKVTAEGTTIKLFLDTTEIGSRTDASYSSGYPAIFTNSTSLSYALDDFEAGDL